MNSPVFTEVSDKETDSLIYTVMYNEVKRLADTSSKKERQRIREFIIAIYREMIRGHQQEG